MSFGFILSSSFHDMGMEIGAFSFRRIEYGATDVAFF